MSRTVPQFRCIERLMEQIVLFFTLYNVEVNPPGNPPYLSKPKKTQVGGLMVNSSSLLNKSASLQEENHDLTTDAFVWLLLFGRAQVLGSI